jgi:MFS family permease
MRPLRTEFPKQSCADGASATFAQKEVVSYARQGDREKTIEIIKSKNDREANDVHKEEIERGEIGIIQKRALLSSFVGWMFDGFETSSQIRFAVGTALGGTLMGWAVGGTVGSIMADYVGRKKMLMVSIVGYCVFTAFTALSQSVMMLIALRFLTGMFLGTEWSTGTALVAETWPASTRAKALGFMQSGYGFGFFLAAGLWLLIQPYAGSEGWRLMFVIGVLPAILVIYVRRQVPESKLWLEAVANAHAGANGEGPTRKLTLVAMFEDKGAVATVFAVLIIASVTVSVFYGITALTGPYIGAIAAKQGLVASAWASISALVYNGGSILGYVTAGFVADAIGRKPYMFLSFLGAILSGVLMYLAPQTLTIALICVFILGVFTLGVFSWMPIYLPELFHTRVRSTAAGVIFNLARLVAFPLPILTAFLFSNLGGYQSTVLALTLLYLIAIIALMTLPETKGRALPA